MKTFRKICIFILFLTLITSIGFSVYWIYKTPPTLTQLELSSFGGINIDSEPKELSYEEKTKHLTMVPVDHEGLKARIDGKAQFFSFAQHSWDGMASRWTSDINISIGKARFVIFDVTDKEPSFGYDAENKYHIIKQFRTIKDSVNLRSDPIPSLKTLQSFYSNRVIKDDFATNIVASMPFDQNKNHDWPMATLLLPENVHYFYEWKENSSLFIQESSFKDAPGLMGLGFQHFFNRQSEPTKRLPSDGGAKMSMRIENEDKKTCAFLLYTKNLDIFIGDKKANAPNKKYLIYVEFPDSSGEAKVSITGPDPHWYAYAKNIESFSFSIDVFNHNLSVSDPEGTFSILDNINKFRDFGTLSAKFNDFPSIGTEDYYRFSGSKNKSSKKIVIRGMATSFEYQGVQYIKGRWTSVPSDIRGAIIGSLMGLLVFFLTKLIDMMGSDKVQKVQIVNRNGNMMPNE